MFKSKVAALHEQCSKGEVETPFLEMTELAMSVEKELHATQIRAKYLEDALRQFKQYV